MTAALRILSALGLILLVPACRFGTPRPDASGTIECTQVQVAPLVAGRIAELPPQEGDLVKAGDLVARLDAQDHILRRDEARALVAQAQAQLDLVRAGSREEDIQRAREQVREARAAAEAAAATLKRIEQVFAQQSATEQQRDDARAQADRTAAALAAAEQTLQRLLKGSRDEEIRVAEATLELARARLATAEKAVADCEVHAPLAATVTTRVREPGEWVAAGTPVLTLSRLDEVWVAVYVPEPRLPAVKLGSSAQVRVDGDARLFEGRVTFVSPEAEFTPRNVQTPEERAKLVYRVKVALANPDGVFKPGMPADAFFTAAPGAR